MFYRITQHFFPVDLSVESVDCPPAFPTVVTDVFDDRTILINSQKALSTLYFVFADVSIYPIDQSRALCSACSVVILRLSAKSILFPINIAGTFVFPFFTRIICSLK